LNWCSSERKKKKNKKMKEEKPLSRGSAWQKLAAAAVGLLRMSFTIKSNLIVIVH
jgi:hypothetical protein